MGPKPKMLSRQGQAEATSKLQMVPARLIKWGPPSSKQQDLWQMQPYP